MKRVQNPMKQVGLFALFVVSALAAVALFGAVRASAQVSLTVETDKTTYEYGEPIEVSVFIRNDTPNQFQLGGSSSCQAQFKFDTHDSSQGPCTTDSIIIDFRPGSWRGWIWTIDPAEMGLPSTDGDHTVIGFYPGTELADTLTISAPAFLGGRVRVVINNNILPEDLASLRDSLNVEVLVSNQRSDGLYENWQISGTSIDSAAVKYSQDPRFRDFDAIRWPSSGFRLVGAEQEIEVAQEATLDSVFPNPCTGICEARISVPSPQMVHFRLLDLLGRTVREWDEFVTASGPYSASIRATELRNGIYFLSARGGAFHSSTTFIKMNH